MANPKTIKLDGDEYIRSDLAAKKLGPEVIIRARDAGFHIGSFDSRAGDTVKLLNARRLYSWTGAFTLNAVATKGVNRSDSRISCAVPEILILGVCEVLPVCEGVDLSSTEK